MPWLSNAASMPRWSSSGSYGRTRSTSRPGMARMARGFRSPIWTCAWAVPDWVCMEVSTPGGLMQMWFSGEYLDVVENHRIVYTESMSDEQGNVMSAADMGMPDSHPTTTEVRVELEDIGGGTKMVLTHTGIPADSPGAAGWAMALDKLAAHVARTAT